MSEIAVVLTASMALGTLIARAPALLQLLRRASAVVAIATFPSSPSMSRDEIKQYRDKIKQYRGKTKRRIRMATLRHLEKQQEEYERALREHLELRERTLVQVWKEQAQELRELDARHAQVLREFEAQRAQLFRELNAQASPPVATFKSSPAGESRPTGQRLDNDKTE